jgi:FKBP-type peptidyl-prolyl cis-trans isomerase
MSLFDKLNKAKEEKSSGNLQAGEDFLAENAKRPEVTTTPADCNTKC